LGARATSALKRDKMKESKMKSFQSKITWSCFIFSLIIFIIAFGQSFDTGIHSLDNAALFFYQSAAVAFIASLTLGIWGNNFKFLYPVIVAVYALLFTLTYSERLYLYLHHNHGVSCIYEATDWSFFCIIMAITFIGMIIGAIAKLILNKNMTNKGANP